MARTKHQDEALFFVVGGISIFSSSLVVLSSFKIGTRTSSSVLNLYLQIFQILDDIASFPILHASDGICKFIAFMRAYSGVGNGLITLLIAILTYRLIFSTSMAKSEYSLSTAAHCIIWLVPFLTLLPFSTDSYGTYESVWCSFTTDDPVGEDWYISFASLTLAMIVASCIILATVICKLHSSDTETLIQVMKCSGAYSVVSIICWFPKLFTISVVTASTSSTYSQHEAMFVSRLTTYIRGLLFAIGYLFSMTSLQKFEAYMQEFPTSIDRDSSISSKPLDFGMDSNASLHSRIYSHSQATSSGVSVDRWYSRSATYSTQSPLGVNSDKSHNSVDSTASHSSLNEQYRTPSVEFGTKPTLDDGSLTSGPKLPSITEAQLSRD